MRTCLKLYHHSEFEDGKSKPRKINIEFMSGGGGNNRDTSFEPERSYYQPFPSPDLEDSRSGPPCSGKFTGYIFMLTPGPLYEIEIIIKILKGCRP